MNKDAQIAVLTLLVCIFFSQKTRAEEIIYDAPEPPMEIALNSANPQTPDAQENLQNLPEPPANEPISAPSKEQINQRFVQLKQQIDSGTQNLDTYFEYAQIATSLGQIKEAEFAYLYMLQASPELDRIKLELGLLYTKIGKFKDAKKLFEEVLATNPPEAVQQNIAQVMAVVDNGLKPDVFSGSVTTGYNMDSNANSAASSGQITFTDTSIPLSEGSTSSRDGHFYVGTALGHTHKFDLDNDDYKLSFQSTGTLYKTRQDTESELDLGLASLRIGPELELPELKTRLGLFGTSSIIDLNGHRYLKTTSIDANASYAILDNLFISGVYSYEDRDFMNSPTATSYTDRSGYANQQVISIIYAPTPVNIFSTSIGWRYEDAASEVYGNSQQSITGSYTRQLPWELALTSMLGFRKTNYHQPDPLISATSLRHDRERSMTYALTKKLPHNMSATGAYQYKNVTSNIQNYDYTNHRYSVSLGWAF